MKKCTKCFKEKELTCFNKHNGTKDRLSNYCKSCISNLSKKRYLDNRENIILRSSKNYIKNRRRKIKTTSVYQKKDNGLYRKYISIIERTSGKNIKYQSYIDKGIKCLWSSYTDFKNDMYSSYILHIEQYGKKNTTIDRIDSFGNYCKENCRWATHKVQNNNKTNNKYLTYKNKTQTVSMWAKEFGLNKSQQTNLYARIRRGWSTERVLGT